MRFELTIDCNNAAFDEDAAAEVARLLYRAACRVTSGATDGPLADANGNVVGSFAFLPDESVTGRNTGQPDGPVSRLFHRPQPD